MSEYQYKAIRELIWFALFIVLTHVAEHLWMSIIFLFMSIVTGYFAYKYNRTVILQGSGQDSNLNRRPEI